MSINQLSDDGAVIGYKPTLEYVKKDKSDAKTEDTTKKSSVTDYSGKIEYSKTLNSFKNNLPSIALNNIDYVTQNMKLLIDKLALSFQNGNWNQYGEISSLLSAIESNNEEYITNFIDYHKNDISKSIVPELIGTIYTTKQRLEILNNTLKEIYYGDSHLTLEKTKEIDNAYLQKIQSYEENNNISKIGYLALSNDSALSRSVSMYCFSINEQVIDISDIINVSDESSGNKTNENLIKKMFNDINKEIEYRKVSYNSQQSIEIMQKTLYNYYNKRQELIDLYNLFSDNKDSFFIGKNIQSYKLELDNAIVNVNKAFAGNQYFLSEIVKLEQDKYLLKNIYDTFSYNSET